MSNTGAACAMYAVLHPLGRMHRAKPRSPGPCCFAGDIIAHERPLPHLETGDHVLLHDTGAYCFSNHFGYNVMTPDPVFGIRRGADGATDVSIISKAQSTADLVRVYS